MPRRRRTLLWVAAATAVVAVGAGAVYEWWWRRRRRRRQSLRWPAEGDSGDAVAAREVTAGSLQRSGAGSRVDAQLLREQYEANRRALRSTVLGLRSLVQARVDRYFDTEGVVRELRALPDGDAPNVEEKRARLWEELVVLSLARLAAAAYAWCALNVLTCVQVNLLGRYVGLAAALERERPPSDSAAALPSDAALLQELLALPHGKPCRAVQAAYLRAARLLCDASFFDEHIGRRLVATTRAVMQQQGLDLHTPLTALQLGEAWQAVCAQVGRASQQPQPPPAATGDRGEATTLAAETHEWLIEWLDALLRHAQAQAGVTGEVSSGNDGEPATDDTIAPEPRTPPRHNRQQLAALLDETRDLIDSLDFLDTTHHIMDALLQRVLEALAADAGPAPSTVTSAESLPLAKWLPACARVSRRLFTDDAFFDAVCSDGALDHFGALVFVSGEKEPPT
ncbi:hypothetical protein CDCA_CDCA11G3290 [Cyanidium caldarium]|uniref:Peroxisomal biogenesis factor 3 n=1 Tax=Cyanidium caldarium TaxID=2771 RepID=A0AAV9IYT9_CYACA|nr:hypothetical protein CDCA_CDCA11G3290 [Cyanidium caldarium]